MSRYTPAARPLVQCLRASSRRSEQATAASTATLALRPAPSTALASMSMSSPHQFRATFVTSSRQWQASPTTTTRSPTSSSSTSSPLPQRLEDLEGWNQDPSTATLPWAEKELMRRGTPPVGSRRRRAALQMATAINRAIAGNDTLAGRDGGPVPFELMPYQCFQEARKVLQADREDKLRQIAAEAAKIRKLEAVLAASANDCDTSTTSVTSRGGTAFLARRLASLRKHVEHLKIMADINDPLVKRRFEDGLGDMSKPIYRHLAEERWRGRPFRLIQQRIEQFHLAPDLLPPAKLQPNADVELFFRSYKVAPGAIVDSLISEVTPRLRVQVFDRGTRLLTVAVVDADVPDLANDGFQRRCHFLAANIPVAPTDASVPLSRLDPASQLVLPWLPAFAQKGSAPHRLAVFVLEQKPAETSAAAAAAPPGASDDNRSTRLDTAALQKAFASDPASAIAATAEDAAGNGSITTPRDGFSISSFANKHGLTVVGCTLFRTEWDAGTAGVMERAGVPGADLELKPKRLPSLKPPRKARGWEAKHQGPKYRHLWKYTHRIATPRRKFVR
ncbi:mitochondrial 54S ribosomal protein YmL35 [Sporothrix curviconia]|uniref:Mitochondrial 54S ribosomal protein YmL35 n=1 Tax=Sporothrix curviconia TaxID=1260050 RepID=A0ABP0B9I7_9PEZI